MNTTLRTAIAAGLLASATNTIAGDIRTQTVRFESAGDTLVGTLYLPEGATATEAVVVTGAWMTVKEQMAGRYAQELAERGIAALAFDFRGWGESAGRPRAFENPERKTQDIVAASGFLQQQLPEARISGLGICASAGYMADAATRTPILKRVALVAPWLHDADIVDQVYGGAEGVAKLISAGQAAERRYAETGREVTVPAASRTDNTAVMFNVPYYTEADRGLIPQWENRFNVASWEGWLRFDAQRVAPKLAQPLLMVHSEAAAIPQGAKQFYATVRAPKQQLWLDGISQFDFYDRDAPVSAASDAVAAFLTTEAAVLPPAGDAKTARVISVVSSIPLAVDLARYDLAEAAFAPAITIDYTSLWGGEPQPMTPAQLMDSWRGIVPGFDATWHELTDVRAEVRGEEATATAHVDGRHWIGERLWRPIGTYYWTLRKLDGTWKVTSMRFAMAQELGDRALATVATERAQVKADVTRP